MSRNEILIIRQDGPKLRTECDAGDIIGQALHDGATVVAIPAERLDPDFFILKTRVAGAFIQKFANYRLRLAVVGDIAPFITASESFRDFVTEANRGEYLWFEHDLDHLLHRLESSAVILGADRRTTSTPNT